MESAGTFHCQRFDCPQDEGDCSLCERPQLSTDVMGVLHLYRRCRRYKTLPMEGGMLNQDEQLMEMFDVVDTALERIRAQKLEQQEGEVMKQRMTATMRSGHA